MSSHLFKICVAGVEGVGKTSLIAKYTRNIFNNNIKSTTMIESCTKNVQYDNDIVKLQFWDITDDQELYTAITKSYYQGAHVVLLCYDITNEKSFVDLSTRLIIIKKIFQDLDNAENKEPIYVLVGCKSDLEELRKISKAQASIFADNNNIKWFETSSKDNNGIDELFTYVIDKLMPKQQVNKDSNCLCF